MNYHKKDIEQAMIDQREFGDILRALADVDSSDVISDSSNSDGMCVLCFADMSIFDRTPRPHDRLCPYQLAVELKRAGRI